MEAEEDEEKSSDDQEDGATDLPVLPKYITRYRRSLYRRPTNLKLEGELYAATENTENFIAYILTGRPDLTRNPTTLKLEGDMETKTEMRDKYIPHELDCKPPISRKSTNLHLEGLFEVTTENRDRFLPFILPPERPPLVKNATNLHLEGVLDLKPSYRDDFVEYKEVHRFHPKLPVHNLKVEGCDGEPAALSDNYKSQNVHPVIPFLRECPKKSDGIEKTVNLKNLNAEDDRDIVLESKIHPVQTQKSARTINKHESHIPSKISTGPEYKNAYVNFYRDAYGKFNVEKDDGKMQRQRRKANIHFSAEADTGTHPDHKQPYADFQRKRQIMRKREEHFKSENELNNVTEKRPLSVKRNAELKLDGPFECQPEYRKAYNDYITREQVDHRARSVRTAGAKTPRAFKTELVNNTEQVVLPKSKLPRPIVSRHESRKQRRNSLSPSTRIGNKENIEEMLFGAKVHTRNRSQTVGPSRPAQRRKSKKRYGSPLLVENLVYAPSISPVQAILRVAARGNFEYGETDHDAPFVVIDKPCCCRRDCGYPRELCKEQRWAPSWYTHPMK